MALPKEKLLGNYLGELSKDKYFLADAKLDDNGVPGGYLLRWAHDLNGDGIDDYFFGTTVNPDQQGVEWTAYLSDGEDSFYRPIEHCFFHPEGVYAKSNGNRGEIGTIVLADIQNAYVFAYSLDESGQIVRAERSLTADELFLMGSAEKADFSDSFGLGKIVPCKVEKLALAEVLTEGTPIWKPYCTDHEIDEQHLDPEEADSVNRLASMPVSSVLDQLSVFRQKSQSGSRPPSAPDQGVSNSTTEVQVWPPDTQYHLGGGSLQAPAITLLLMIILLATAAAIVYRRTRSNR